MTPESRRRFLAGAGASVAAGLSQTSGAKAETAASAPPFHLIFEAEWNDIPCADYPLTQERWLRECIRPLAGTRVDTLLYNLCSSDGYCCELKSGELLCDAFDQVANAWVWRYRENTKKLIAADANPPKLAVEYGHRLGLKVIPIVRMNDPHDQYFKYEVSRFKMRNPQFLLGHGTYPIDWEAGFRGLPSNLKKGMDSHTWGMFDFAHAEVRDRKMAIIEEFITRWDNDGISLDFDRDPRYFREFGKSENAALMTGLMRRVKAILDRVGKQRGRKLYFHARVIPDIDVCYERGLDVRTWVAEGLIDAVTPGCGYMTVSLDLRPWLELVKGKPCFVYPSINHWRVTEETRAWAALMYEQGAHGVQLFNFGHLLHGQDTRTVPESSRQGSVWYGELHPEYYRVLDELHDPASIRHENKRYVLESVPHERLEGEGGQSHREFRAVGAIRLPVELKMGRHEVAVPVADDLEAATRQGLDARITLRLKLVNYTPPDEFDVSWNGRVLPRTGRSERAVFIMNDQTWVTWNLAPDQVKKGSNLLALEVRRLNSQMSSAPVLNNLEVWIEYV